MNTCAKCGRVIAKNDLIHWPEGKEQHIDCIEALNASFDNYVPSLGKPAVKYLGSAIDETWNG